MSQKIYIGKDFFDDPAGRYYTDGDGSGEEFREEVLRPLLEKLDELEINIDKDVEGYGSSFLVEAFGGLIKHGYFSASQLKSKLVITMENQEYQFFKKKIEQYIEQAKYNSEEYVSSKQKAVNSGVFKGVIKKDFVKELIR